MSLRGDYVNWDALGAMVAVSVAVSSLMAFMVSLMIRSAIAEASNKITNELHQLVRSNYVDRAVYDSEMDHIRERFRRIEEGE
jgi:hypothetical protein